MTDNHTNPESNQSRDHQSAAESPDTGAAAEAGSLPPIALYSTEGQLVAGNQSADERDDQAQQVFGEQLLAAIVNSTYLYVRVKLVQPPRRPQTYVARMTLQSSDSMSAIGDRLDALVSQIGFEYAADRPTDQFRQALTTVTDTSNDIGDHQMIQRAAQAMPHSDAALRFTAGTMVDALSALTTLGAVFETVVLATAGDSRSGTGMKATSAALVILDSSQTGIEAATNTHSALQTAREQLRTERRDEALNDIRDGIASLAAVETDSAAVRTAVEQLLPDPAPSRQRGKEPVHQSTDSQGVSVSEDTQRATTDTERRFNSILRTGGSLVLLLVIAIGAGIIFAAWSEGATSVPEFASLDVLLPLIAALLILMLILAFVVQQRL